MNALRLLVPLFAVALTSAACGGSVCEEAGRQQTVINDKVKGCPQIAAQVNSGNISRGVCESKLLSASCTETDRQLYANMFTCIEGLEQCLSGQETAFQTKVGNCRLPLQSRTTACRDAIGF